ncbi:hypothetical protein GCM10009091_40380 [Pseudomonas brenneri]|nr:hypothetical protein GCM10009091_40380 [Pseudomonas brenneri]
MVYGVQLVGCRICLVEQFSGISAGYMEYRSYALEASQVIAKKGGGGEVRVVFTNPIPRNNKAPTYMLGLCFVWFGIRRTVYFGAARFSAGLEVGGKFGVPPPPKKTSNYK